MTLEEFIASNPDPRELKRALVVKMRHEKLKHREIQAILGVASSYISHWEAKYQERGVEGLRLAYRGSQGYLNQAQRTAVIEWIQAELQRNIEEVIEHLQQEYGVTYRSLQSYYDLLRAGGMSWHQGRKKVPSMTQKWCKSEIR